MLGELTQNEIEEVLDTNVIGRIGCCLDGKMLVVPITYVYDGSYVIGHTVEGMKIEMLRKNPECCFEVDEMQGISTWRSVIAWGTYEELSGGDAEAAIKILMDKITPLRPSETSHPMRMGQSSLHRTQTQGKNPIIYRIRLKEKTGRYEHG